LTWIGPISTWIDRSLTRIGPDRSDPPRSADVSLDWADFGPDPAELGQELVRGAAFVGQDGGAGVGDARQHVVRVAAMNLQVHVGIHAFQRLVVQTITILNV